MKKGKKITDKERLDWYSRNGGRVVAGYQIAERPELPSVWFVFCGGMKPGKQFRTIRQAIDSAIRAGRKK